MGLRELHDTLQTVHKVRLAEIVEPRQLPGDDLLAKIAVEGNLFQQFGGELQVLR